MNSPAGTKKWAVAIHGGAGAIPRSLSPERRLSSLAALDRILRSGVEQLEDGCTALDVVESLAVLLEDEPSFNAGCGSVFTRDGTHELEASIMDGASGNCGAVSGLTTVRNPIRLARRVMEETPHVMLGGRGAEAFADTTDLERVDNTFFDTVHRRRELERAAQDPTLANQEGSTIGAVAMDMMGRCAAATSTGGMTAKWAGRIGDSPLIGSGTHADGHGAISCTGHGEVLMRHVVAHEISAMHRHGDVSLPDAAEAVLGRLPSGSGGVILVDVDGPHAIINAPGMYRGLAGSAGRFETAIWTHEGERS